MKEIREDLHLLHQAFLHSSNHQRSDMLSLQFAEYLDNQDDLKNLRDEFCIPLMQELPFG